MHAAVPGGIFLISAASAWKWETVGGVLLVLEGLFVAAAYPVWAHGRFPVSTIVFVLSTMALPPIAAGCLFVAGGRQPGSFPGQRASSVP
jgi:hypothetical protein